MSDAGKIDVPMGDDKRIETVQLFWNAIVSKLNPEKCKRAFELVYLEDDDSGSLIEYIDRVSDDPECNWELIVDYNIACNYGCELDEYCIAWLKSLIGVSE